MKRFALLLLCVLACDRTRVGSTPARKAEARVAARDAAVDQVVTEDAQVASAVPVSPTLQRNERRLMGTMWQITVVSDDAEKARVASSRAFDEVARLEASLSEWRADSDISRVNQSAGIAPVEVGPELIACVRVSLDVARWSGGAYDISWAALRGVWDFSADSTHVPPSKAEVKKLLPLWNYRNIVLDEAKRTVFLKKKGMQIGLGGVAKGYALDRAGELLIEQGLPNFLIYAGGQVLVHGRKGDRKWRVGIQHPREPRHFAFAEMEDGSLATSGDYEHAYRHQGVIYHHIIDPKTGFPSRRTASVTLITKSALWADAVDTAVFIMGPERGLSALPQAPGAPHEAVIVDPEMKLVLSDDARQHLVMTADILPDGTIGPARSP